MYIRFNSTSAMMTLSNEDQQELWQTVKSQNEQVYCKIREKIKQGAKLSSVDDMVYAIRVYTPLKKNAPETDSQQSSSSEKDSLGKKKSEGLKYKKNMFCLKRDAARGLTLQTFLSDHVVPKLKKIDYFVSCPETIERAIIQGVEPSPETDMLWLVENCAHPDGFLYICCK